MPKNGCFKRIMPLTLLRMFLHEDKQVTVGMRLRMYLSVCCQK